ASLGLFQYGWSMPKLRREYEKNPFSVLQANGIPTEAGSPQRELFENRLRSVEPLATFALTNSLAGFLAPWLITALAIGVANFSWPVRRTAPVVFFISPAVLGSCLLLTKSRTAYLAAVVGVALTVL